MIPFVNRTGRGRSVAKRMRGPRRRVRERGRRGTMKHIRLLSATASLGLLTSIGIAPFANAQTGDQSQAAPSGMEEVVVTARRLEEKIQTVPQAITAFSQKDLETRHITQIEDFARSVPSLGVSQTSSD